MVIRKFFFGGLTGPHYYPWVLWDFDRFGIYIHLILDEIYGIDLGNRRVKKSAWNSTKIFYTISNPKFNYLYIYLASANYCSRIYTYKRDSI